MNASKLSVLISYLLVMGYYGQSLGSLPNILGLWIPFVIPSPVGIIYSFIQIFVAILLIISLSRNVIKEKTLLIIVQLVFGINVFLHILALGKTPEPVLYYSIITIVLYVLASVFYFKNLYKYSIQ